MTLAGYETRYLSRDGLALAVHVQPGDGPLFVFQHGLCGAAGQPAEVMPAGTGYRHAVLDCRGHGVSAAGETAALSIATFAGDVAAMIEMLATGPAVVGGISMGAAIASRLAVKRPDLVRGLVLARPAWVTAAAPANMHPNLDVGLRLAAPARKDEAEAFRASPVGQTLATEAPDNLVSLEGFIRREPRAITAALLTQISRDGPGVTADDLAALRLPALVIGHGEDAIHPFAHASALAALVPGAALIRIPSKSRDRNGYFEAFRTALAAFLTGLRKEPA